MVSRYRFKKVLLTISILVLLVIVFYFLMNAITRYTGLSIFDDSKMDVVDNCLRERDIKFYTNSDNLGMSLKDSEVIDVLDDVEIINCLRNSERCLDDGIDEFPTWIIEGVKLKKDVTYLELLEYSKC